MLQDEMEKKYLTNTTKCQKRQKNSEKTEKQWKNSEKTVKVNWR